MGSILLGLAAAMLAIGITSFMDGNGLTQFSALPLAGLLAVFWMIGRNGRRDVGMTWPKLPAFAAGIIHPLLVLPVLGAAAFIFGDASMSGEDVAQAAQFALIVGASTFIVVIVTEEGFFRGWLWASFRKGGVGTVATLVATSVIFMLWHVSFVTLDTGFDLPTAQLPVFLGNALVLGLIWGLMRHRSDSVLAPSLAHGIWNGVVYILFGIGGESGQLQFTQTEIFGPEAGMLGLALNGIFLIGYALYRPTSPVAANADRLVESVEHESGSGSL